MTVNFSEQLSIVIGGDSINYIHDPDQDQSSWTSKPGVLVPCSWEDLPGGVLVIEIQFGNIWSRFSQSIHRIDKTELEKLLVKPTEGKKISLDDREYIFDINMTDPINFISNHFNTVCVIGTEQSVVLSMSYDKECCTTRFHVSVPRNDFLNELRKIL